MSMLRIDDSDTGESFMDIVKIPEGFSFQMQMKIGAQPVEFVSVIVSGIDADRIVTFMLERMPK